MSKLFRVRFEKPGVVRSYVVRAETLLDAVSKAKRIHGDVAPPLEGYSVRDAAEISTGTCASPAPGL